MPKFPAFIVNNYSEMLTKLACYAFFVVTFCVFLLRNYVSPVEKLSESIDVFFVEKIGFTFYVDASIVGVFFISFGIAVVAHAIKLHDQLSGLLQIRKEFDVNYVLYPLAIASGASLSIQKFSQIRQQRENLMGPTFYRYVSSTNPVIDKHTITQALTNWSWFWICLEAITFLTITATVLMIYRAWIAAAILLSICILLLLLMRFFRLQSAKYAESQIKQILDDGTRHCDVAARFNAL